jgi:hypothetical protein
MELGGRKCLLWNKVPATWLFNGLGVDYPDGRNPAVVTKIFLERETDGKILEALPAEVTFIKEPEPLADDPGHPQQQH